MLRDSSRTVPIGIEFATGMPSVGGPNVRVMVCPGAGMVHFGRCRYGGGVVIIPPASPKGCQTIRGCPRRVSRPQCAEYQDGFAPTLRPAGEVFVRQIRYPAAGAP
jgi:hypothetical protein